MNVIAIRDDGALLVADGEATAIVAGHEYWITSKGSAMARGVWAPSGAPAPDIPGLAEDLAAFRREWEASPKI